MADLCGLCWHSGAMSLHHLAVIILYGVRLLFHMNYNVYRMFVSSELYISINLPSVVALHLP